MNLLFKCGRRILSSLLSDKAYIKLIYRIRMHERLNLENPKTFTEKLQYLKLYNRNPLYTRMVDKVSVKEYVSSLIGEEHVIPTLAIYDRAEDIDFNALPDSFVMKVSHDSGGLVICKNKNGLNKEETREKLKKALRFDYFRYSREWPYKDVKRKILVEKYMKNGDSDELVDYKFYCFNGKPEFLYFSRHEHQENEEITFYTLDWKEAPFQRSDHKRLSIKPEKPQTLAEMIKTAEILSRSIPFVRIDLYEINGRVYFGEFSFYPTGGLFELTPKIYNRKTGDLLDIGSIKPVL